VIIFLAVLASAVPPEWFYIRGDDRKDAGHTIADNAPMRSHVYRALYKGWVIRSKTSPLLGHLEKLSCGACKQQVQIQTHGN